MFRIKTGLCACAMCLLLAASASAQSDILDAAHEGETVRYNTVTVEKGTFERTFNAQASVYYPLCCEVYFQQGNAVFSEYAVSKGDEVQVGDVLMRFYVEGSESELKRLELALERSQEDMKEGVRTREEEISTLRITMSAEKDSYEKQKMTISLRKLQTELEQYKTNQSYSILQQQRALDEARQRMEVCELVSPADGVVADLTYKKAGADLAAGELLMTIVREDMMLVRVQDSGALLRCGMSVTVESGSGSNRSVTTGRVVACDESVSKKERTGYAYIQLDEYEAALKMRNIKVTASTMKLENVLVVPRSILKTEQGAFYVSRLYEGRVQKRYVTVGLNDYSGVWLLDGVAEGDVLIED